MKNLCISFLLIFTAYNSRAQCYEGDCSNGFGRMKYGETAEYAGYFKNDNPNGIGIVMYASGVKYFGEFVAGEMQGKGVKLLNDGTRLYGTFEKGTPIGLGMYEKGDALALLIWKDGKPEKELSKIAAANNPENCQGNCIDGLGMITNEDKSVLTGHFENGKISYGKINTTKFKYIGEIKNNKPHGFGLLITEFKNYYGYFIDGKKDGKGVVDSKLTGIHEVNYQFGKDVSVVTTNAARTKKSFKYTDEDFKKELYALINSTEEERENALDKTEGNPFGNLLEYKFLGEFEVSLSSMFLRGDQYTIYFPTTNSGKPTVSYTEILKILDSEATNYGGVYKFENDVEVEIEKRATDTLLTISIKDEE